MNSSSDDFERQAETLVRLATSVELNASNRGHTIELGDPERWIFSSLTLKLDDNEGTWRVRGRIARLPPTAYIFLLLLTSVSLWLGAQVISSHLAALLCLALAVGVVLSTVLNAFWLVELKIRLRTALRGVPPSLHRPIAAAMSSQQNIDPPLPPGVAPSQASLREERQASSKHLLSEMGFRVSKSGKYLFVEEPGSYRSAKYRLRFDGPGGKPKADVRIADMRVSHYLLLLVCIVVALGVAPWVVQNEAHPPTLLDASFLGVSLLMLSAAISDLMNLVTIRNGLFLVVRAVFNDPLTQARE